MGLLVALRYVFESWRTIFHLRRYADKCFARLRQVLVVLAYSGFQMNKQILGWRSLWSDGVSPTHIIFRCLIAIPFLPTLSPGHYLFPSSYYCNKVSHVAMVPFRHGEVAHHE
jgi:hypothetical protein